MSVDDAVVSEVLARLEWKARPHGKHTLRCKHVVGEDEIIIYVRKTENWFIASVVPFLSTRGDNSFELARWLLRMNRDMNQCKFAYDEDGDVVLTVELPTESLDAEEIEAALEALLRHALAHRATLRAAAG